jgi:hypothetical protein
MLYEKLLSTQIEREIDWMRFFESIQLIIKLFLGSRLY